MNKSYQITITNGEGTENIFNGSYNVTSSVTGYDNSTIDPASVVVVEGTNEYSFTVGATGSLTLHVTEDGTVGGTAVVGATFIRTDSIGTEYGDPITTNESGNAVFANIPYDSLNAPTIYYKQTSSDGSHEFDSNVLETSLNDSTKTIEITNAKPALRTISVTDANYSGLPVSGQLNIEESI